MNVAVKCADVDALPYLSLDLRPRSVRGERETESKSGTTRSPSAVSRIHRHLHRRLLSILLSRVQYLLLHVPRARISEQFPNPIRRILRRRSCNRDESRNDDDRCDIRSSRNHSSPPPLPPLPPPPPSLTPLHPPHRRRRRNRRYPWNRGRVRP